MTRNTRVARFLEKIPKKHHLNVLLVFDEGIRVGKEAQAEKVHAALSSLFEVAGMDVENPPDDHY